MHSIHYLLPFCPEGINNSGTFEEDFTGMAGEKSWSILIGNTGLVVYIEFKLPDFRNSSPKMKILLIY